MRHSKSLVGLGAVALGLPFGVVACWPTTGGNGSSSSSTPTAPTTDPPVIQALDMTASASAVNGTYTITGSITYSDDDDVVTAIKVNVPVIGKTYTFAASQPYEATADAEPFEFTLSADVPLGGAGETDYIVTLVNQSGAVSAGVEETVDLL
jgi:hypothetical protein